MPGLEPRSVRKRPELEEYGKLVTLLVYDRIRLSVESEIYLLFLPLRLIHAELLGNLLLLIEIGIVKSSGRF